VLFPLPLREGARGRGTSSAYSENSFAAPSLLRPDGRVSEGEERAGSAEAAEGLPVPRRYWAHLAIAVTVTMAVMDGSIANVALPTIARDLGTTSAAIIWVVNAYQLAICVSLLVLGSLGDIHGYHRVYRACIVIFIVASLGCAFSPSLLALSTARFFQGLGGAGILGVSNAIVRTIYPRKELPIGIGRNALVVAIALVAGPSLASAILAVASWPWLFAVNVPLGLAALAIGARVLPRTEGSGHAFDAVSAALNVLAFGGLVLGIEGFGHGDRSLATVLEGLVGVLAMVMLVRRQRAVRSPLLPLDLLRIRLFALSVSTTFLASMAQIMAYVAIPFLFQERLGLTQVQTGLLITPWPVMVGLVAPVAGRLAQRFSAGLLSSLGLAILSVGLLLLAGLAPGAGTADIVWRMLVAGLGYGIFLPPNSSTVLAAAPRERSGGASSMAGTARVLGQAIGSAAVALLFGLAPEHGSAWALATGAGIALLGVAISAARSARLAAS